jgi:N-acetylglucosamine-6-sulfatase
VGPRIATAIACVCALVFSLAGSAAGSQSYSTASSAGQSGAHLSLPAEPPNIILFYVDDVSPHDGSLWNDPTRTPNFVDRFIDHGIDFDHAIGENPLCCPARGNLLTGLHSHNNGVIENNALLFDPSEHIGKALKEAGYASMFIGKYLNHDNDLSPEQWAQHDAGWTQLDVINNTNGLFYNYLLHTKQGDFTVRALHSTQMVADRTVMHLRETPAEQPVFAVLSIYNMHGPNIPMAQDIGDPRCAHKAPWNPPNYNEADVSDKPAEIQALPLLPDADGWPLVTYCEEMLGVDRAIGQVVDELEADGRLDNTLLLFTADNGMAWGAHRLPQAKVWPYTTPVPLYMSWPAAGWGNPPRTISEITSNIDLAPTFCELAQTCVLGPFAHGNEVPDGKSLVSLINGTATDLGRDAVLEESFLHDGWSWSALRTTELYDSDDRWHYIEYTNGLRELYDLVADPYELQNIASDLGHAEVVTALSARLAQLRLEGVNAGTGTLRIALDARPDTGTDYTFGGDLGAFTLDDDADPVHPNEMIWSNLQTGRYTFTRPSHAPWIPADIDCVGVAFLDRTVGSATIYVHPGEQVSCTWIDATRRPDASVSLTAAGPYKKDNLYQTIPTKKQTVRRNGVVVGNTYMYRLRIQNDSGANDDFRVRGDIVGPNTFSVTYTQNGTDVTPYVVAGTNHVDGVEPGATRDIIVRITPGPKSKAGDIFRILLRVSSATDPNIVDVVRVVAAR